MVTRNCSNCNIPLERAGDMKFRVGGYSGIGGMFLGGWNQLAETTQTFTLYRCNQCGKVELYEPGIGDAPDLQGQTSGEKKHHFL
ncbi:MAG: nucleotide-binding protein [Candidatus Thermoplasmatota archaeon]|nr:nucleotide-binding protein [Candidatus Thermoplasmatota archaeon]